MGSASKEKTKLSRVEAVERLRALASQIEEGAILFGGEAIEVPEQVRLELKADSGDFEIELKWKPAKQKSSAAEEPTRSAETARH